MSHDLQVIIPNAVVQFEAVLEAGAPSPLHLYAEHHRAARCFRLEFPKPLHGYSVNVMVGTDCFGGVTADAIHVETLHMEAQGCAYGCC